MNRRDEKMRYPSFNGTTVVGRWRSPQWPLRLTPTRLLIIVAAAVFFAELIIMLVLALLPPIPDHLRPLVDATTMLLLLSPGYFILYLPLKKHYQEHLRIDRENRLLSAQMIRAVEDEKKRLARNLHDDCGQTLTALQFGLEALRTSLPEVGPEARRQFDFLRELVGRLSDHIRSVTSDLRPPLLENCGLVEALQWHVDELTAGGCGFDIETHIEDCRRLDPDIEIALYRVFQEGMNNIVKHAGAAKVTVRLFCDPERIGLTLDDDGRGFAMAQQGAPPEIRQGLGLVGMRERIGAVGGSLVIRSAPGKGTRIWARIPLSRKDLA